MDSLNSLFEIELSIGLDSEINDQLLSQFRNRQVVFVAYKDEEILRPFKDNVEALTKDVGLRDVHVAYTWFFDP